MYLPDWLTIAVRIMIVAYVFLILKLLYDAIKLIIKK